MDIDKLKREASEMSEADLKHCLEWNLSLREHYDDNFDFSNYNVAEEKVKILTDELRKRG